MEPSNNTIKPIKNENNKDLIDYLKKEKRNKFIIRFIMGTISATITCALLIYILYLLGTMMQ